MMRRLSSFKSAPKSLVDNISFDPEFYGYENGGAVFTDDPEEEIEEMYTTDHDITCATPTTIPTTLTTPTMNTANVVNVSDSETNNDSDESESCSESDSDSSTIQKKGLRRFFCMPVRSMKAMKSLRMAKKPQQQKSSLLAEE